MTYQNLKTNKNIFKEEFKKRIYRFVLRLVKFVSSLPNNRTCWIIGDQLLRSGTSIIGNYVEAQAASSKKDFINFFTHSLKSSNESKLWLGILRDTDNGDKEEIKFLLNEVSEFAKIFASSILTLKGKK